MFKKILLMNSLVLPEQRIKKALKVKNEIFEYKDIHLEDVADGFFDYIFYTHEDIQKFKNILKYRSKYRIMINFTSVKKVGITGLNITEEDILNYTQKTECLDVAKEVNHFDNFLGFFYYDFFDMRNLESVIIKMYKNKKKDINYPQDRVETFFHTKHMTDIIIQVIRDEEILNSSLLKNNKFINLSYDKNYKISEIADFLSSKVLFLEPGEGESFSGSGSKIKKVFTTNSYFDLASGILYNQR